jgi:hypothetical protein
MIKNQNELKVLLALKTYHEDTTGKFDFYYQDQCVGGLWKHQIKTMTDIGSFRLSFILERLCKKGLIIARIRWYINNNSKSSRAPCYILTEQGKELINSL